MLTSESPSHCEVVLTLRIHEKIEGNWEEREVSMFEHQAFHNVIGVCGSALYWDMGLRQATYSGGSQGLLLLLLLGLRGCDRDCEKKVAAGVLTGRLFKTLTDALHNSKLTLLLSNPTTKPKSLTVF